MTNEGKPGTIRVGVSSCLLGESVRWDGGHKRDAFLTETLARFVEWVPVCPEVEIGLGVPRPTLRLERDARGVRLVAPKTGVEWTSAMQRYAARRVRELRSLDLCGYVLKKDSPSCGMERVRVYGGRGAPAREGVGLFASTLRSAWPHLPMEEEGRLRDPRLRENFIQRVFAYRRLEDFFRERWSLGKLIEFHSRQKLLLMAHSPRAYAELGRLVAGGRHFRRAELRDRYQTAYMAALSTPATTPRHANVLQHMMGYFRKRLSSEERAELHELIADYRAGLVPLIVPATLFGHHVRRLRVDYLAHQVYLDPHPKELMLRNHC